MEISIIQSVYKLENQWKSFLTTGQTQCTSNGKYLVCLCPKVVHFIDLENGAATIWKIEMEEDEILQMLLSADEEFLTLALKSGSLMVYDCSNIPSEPSVIGSFKSFYRGPITAQAIFSRMLATGGSDGVVRMWDLQKKFCTHKMDASGLVSTILFDRNLASRPWLYAIAENHIYVWLLHADSSELVAKLSDHYSTVTDIQLPDDDKLLISCGLDKVIIIWNLETLKAEKILPVYESISVMCLQPKNFTFSNIAEDTTDIHALVVGDKGFLSVWNVSKGRREWVADKQIVQLPNSKGVTVIPKMQFVPSIESIVITTYENSILFLNYKTFQVWKQLTGNHDQVLDLIFCGEEDTHLVVATNSGQFSVFDRKSANCCLVAGHQSSVISLSCHPTIKYIFGSSSNDNTARIWNLNGGNPICLFVAKNHTHSVTSIALSENYFITASKDTCIKSWKLPSDKLKASESSFKVTLSNSIVAHSADINCLQVSKHGRTIASGSEDKTVKIWSSDLKELGVLRGHRRAIWCVIFSPVDQIVATASADSTIKIWSLSDYSVIKSLEEHSKAVLQLTWVSNGKQILSTGSDGLMKLWSVKEGVCSNTIEGHEGEVWALATSEKTVVTGGEDATVYWWKDVAEEEEQQKQQQITNMAENEQQLHNLVRSKKWRKALVLSIGLNQPYRTLTILKDLYVESVDSIPQVLSKIGTDDLASLLEYTQSWMTQPRNLTVARVVLKFFLTEKTPEELEEIRGYKIAVASLLPYTERHAKRTAAHQQSSEIFDFVLFQLSLK